MIGFVLVSTPPAPIVRALRVVGGEQNARVRRGPRRAAGGSDGDVPYREVTKVPRRKEPSSFRGKERNFMTGLLWTQPLDCSIYNGLMTYLCFSHALRSRTASCPCGSWSPRWTRRSRNWMQSWCSVGTQALAGRYGRAVLRSWCSEFSRPGCHGV